MKKAIIALTFVAILVGCSTEPILPAPLSLPQKTSPANESIVGSKSKDGSELVRTNLPSPPEPERLLTGNPPAPQPPAEEKPEISVAFEQIPVPGFIQAVYSNVLKRNINLDAQVAQRQDLVTFRSGSPQTKSQLEAASRLLLKSFGINVVDAGGLVRFVPDSTTLGYLPEIRRGWALPSTPLPLRPIFQLVELRAVRHTDIATWLTTLYGGRVKVTEDPARNAVMLAGNSDDVLAAIEAIQVLDQPSMNGRQSVRITPTYWAADELSKKLAELLQVEGYRVGNTPGGLASFPITILPVSAVNAIFCFAGDKKILDHVVDWARELDSPTSRASRAFFSYRVQFNDAQRLATTLEKIISGNSPAVAAGSATSATKIPRVVVDAGSNTIIYQGNSEDYGQIRSLLETLDKPAKEALIEVTVAQVDLTDHKELGVAWLAKAANLDGSKITYGTLGGLTLGTGGFSYARVDSAGVARLMIDALANSNRATVLSSPRVIARNGETATIQVGHEVPIITSQQTTPVTGGNGGILQTVQYRTTGVILSVKPVIHSSDQVEIDVSQEVSSAAATNTGVNTSPTFATRKIQTKLTLKNGSTVMLGGLISSDKTGGRAGVPLLMDVPVIGQLFRTDTIDDNRTELIVIITPYILSSDEDAIAVTEAFKSRLGPWAQTQSGATPAVGPAILSPNLPEKAASK